VYFIGCLRANMEGKNFIQQPGVHFEEYINYSKENKE
jgi:hypothetical protein